MSRLISIGRIGVWLAASVALTGAAPAQLPSDPPSYELRFDRPAKASKFSEVYPGLATWAYFGAEPPARAKGQAISRQLRATSRMWPGTLNVNVDPDYCPGATTPSVSEGALQIEAYRLADKDVGTCGLGRPWASAYVSSQPSFSQAYGYFEVDARLPCDPGRWPAFWLLPTAKTAENGGRLAEIDVFEHYGGPITVISQGRPFVINRVGQPFSTLHTGKVGAEQAFSNARALPALTEAQRQAFCQARHTFGVLWTPAEFSFYIDRRETFRTPNPGVSDPHYWVLNMDVSARAGDPNLAPDPSTLMVYSVKAWRAP